MDSSTRTATRRTLQEIDSSNDFDSLYVELERRILTLISDDEDDDFVVGMNSKQSNSMRMNRQRFILEEQHENYFCWKKLDNGNSVPVSILKLWRNTSNGTGVFIPRAVGSRRGYKPSRRCKGKERTHIAGPRKE